MKRLIQVVALIGLCLLLFGGAYPYVKAAPPTLDQDGNLICQNVTAQMVLEAAKNVTLFKLLSAPVDAEDGQLEDGVCRTRVQLNNGSIIPFRVVVKTLLHGERAVGMSFDYGRAISGQ